MGEPVLDPGWLPSYLAYSLLRSTSSAILLSRATFLDALVVGVWGGVDIVTREEEKKMGKKRKISSKIV